MLKRNSLIPPLSNTQKPESLMEIFRRGRDIMDVHGPVPAYMKAVPKTEESKEIIDLKKGTQIQTGDILAGLMPMKASSNKPPEALLLEELLGNTPLNQLSLENIEKILVVIDGLQHDLKRNPPLKDKKERRVIFRQYADVVNVLKELQSLYALSRSVNSLYREMKVVHGEMNSSKITVGFVENVANNLLEQYMTLLHSFQDKLDQYPTEFYSAGIHKLTKKHIVSCQKKLVAITSHPRIISQKTSIEDFSFFVDGYVQSYSFMKNAKLSPEQEILPDLDTLHNLSKTLESGNRVYLDRWMKCFSQGTDAKSVLSEYFMEGLSHESPDTIFTKIANLNELSSTLLNYQQLFQQYFLKNNKDQKLEQRYRKFDKYFFITITAIQLITEIYRSVLM